MAPQPQSVGTIIILGPMLKSIPSLAPTAIGETIAADISGGTCLHYNHRPPFHHEHGFKFCFGNGEPARC
jgi:hypothetical protein